MQKFPIVKKTHVCNHYWGVGGNCAKTCNRDAIWCRVFKGKSPSQNLKLTHDASFPLLAPVDTESSPAAAPHVSASTGRDQWAEAWVRIARHRRRGCELGAIRMSRSVNLFSESGECKHMRSVGGLRQCRWLFERQVKHWTFHRVYNTDDWIQTVSERRHTNKWTRQKVT